MSLSYFAGTNKMLRLHQLLNGDARHVRRNDELLSAEGYDLSGLHNLKLLHQHRFQFAISICGRSCHEVGH